MYESEKPSSAKNDNIVEDLEIPKSKNQMIKETLNMDLVNDQQLTNPDN